MTVFDTAFKQAMASPFEAIHHFKQTDGTLLEVVGIFTADQVQETINGAKINKTMYSLEFDRTYLDQLPIAVNSIFIIDGNHYRVTKAPFVDEIGWATIELQKTAAT